MALYAVDITFTGDVEYKQRPFPMKIVVRARTLHLAAKRTCKYAKKKWPYYRFVVTLCDCDKVLT